VNHFDTQLIDLRDLKGSQHSKFQDKFKLMQKKPMILLGMNKQSIWTQEMMEKATRECLYKITINKITIKEHHN